MFMCDTSTSSTQCYRLIWFKYGSNLYAQEHMVFCVSMIPFLSDMKSTPQQSSWKKKQ